MIKQTKKKKLLFMSGYEDAYTKLHKKILVNGLSGTYFLIPVWILSQDI